MSIAVTLSANFIFAHKVIVSKISPNAEISFSMPHAVFDLMLHLSFYFWQSYSPFKYKVYADRRPALWQASRVYFYMLSGVSIAVYLSSILITFVTKHLTAHVV